MINKAQRRRAIVMVFLTVAIDMLGSMLAMPIMANFVRDVQGEPEECGLSAGSSVARMAPGVSAACDQARADIDGNVGLPSTLYAVAGLVSSFWMPKFSDSRGRRAAFIVSLVGSLGGFLGLALTQSFTMLLIVRFTGGLFGGSMTVANAYITDVYDKNERTPMFTRLGAMMMSLVMIGPLLGSTLAQLLGLRGPFWVSAAMSSGALLFALAYLKNPAELHTDGSPSFESRVDDESESVQLVVGGGQSIQDAGAPDKEQAAAKTKYNAWLQPLNLMIGCQTLITTIAFNGFNQMLALLLLQPKYGIVDPTDSIEVQGQATAGQQALTMILVAVVAMVSFFWHIILFPY
jgi:MFS family permease